MKVDRKEAFHTSSVVGNYLNIYFGQEQGVRLGESSVVSLKVHQLVPGRKGQVKILTNRDAGQCFLEYIDPGQVVHLSVFHQQGTIHPREVAKRIFAAIEDYLQEEEPSLSFMGNDKVQKAVDYALKIQVVTCEGKGLVYDLFQGQVEPLEPEERVLNHVRVLIKVGSDRYSIILPIAAAVEEAITATGLELGKVRKITHTKAKEREERFSNYVLFPWRQLKNISRLTLRENQNQLVMRLADRFGSIEEVEEFLASYSPSIFHRMSKEQQHRKWGNLEEHLQQLEELGIVKTTFLGTYLTRDGKDLRDFILSHKCELEAEIRRSIRRKPKKSGRICELGENIQRVTTIQYVNYNKVKRQNDDTWSGHLAIPQTVIQAQKSSLLRHENRLTIQKEDLHYYDKRHYIPMDVCLLIDASASMAGEKRQAACYLAEHLLLSGREKVAVVTFQEMKAQLVVPFTKNQKTLSRGLKNVRPGGLTPLADGIVTSIEVIRSTRVNNPVLILITDGMPNFPLWSFDAKKDALEAAYRIAESKVRFICIGVESNKDYLKELAHNGKGKLYVVDDLNRNNLVDIMTHEKRVATSV
ncbi:MAG: vWA domain-containing protein [Bacillota bacterium]